MRSLTVFVSPMGCRGEPDRVVRLPGVSVPQVQRHGFAWVETIGVRRFLITARYLNHDLPEGPTLIETERQEFAAYGGSPTIDIGRATPINEYRKRS